MNTQTVADAIAARFAGITAGAEALAIGPTADLPNAITRGPALLVYHPEGELSIGVSRQRGDRLTFPVRLLRDPLDVPSRSRALYAWYDAMRDLVEAQMTLGLAYVAWAQPAAVRIELDGETYGGTTFDVVEIMVTVQYNETVTTVAA